MADLPEYLAKPDFDPSKLKIAELMSILSIHNIDLPGTRQKKDFYLQLFDTHIMQKREQIVAERKKLAQKPLRRPRSGIFIDMSSIPSPQSVAQQKQSVPPETPKRRKMSIKKEKKEELKAETEPVIKDEPVFSSDNPFQSPSKSPAVPAIRARRRKTITEDISTSGALETPVKKQEVMSDTYAGGQYVPSPQPFMMRMRSPDLVRTTAPFAPQELPVRAPIHEPKSITKRRSTIKLDDNDLIEPKSTGSPSISSLRSRLLNSAKNVPEETIPTSTTSNPSVFRTPSRTGRSGPVPMEVDDDFNLLDFSSPAMSAQNIVMQEVGADPFGSPIPQKLQTPLRASSRKQENIADDVNAVEPIKELPAKTPSRAPKFANVQTPVQPRESFVKTPKPTPFASKTPKVPRTPAAPFPATPISRAPEYQTPANKASYQTINDQNIPKVEKRRTRKSLQPTQTARKGLSDGSAALFTGSFLLILLVCLIHWYHTFYDVIGYCNANTINHSIENKYNPLSYVLPTCIPCPPHAICSEKAVISCDSEYTLTPGPIAKAVDMALFWIPKSLRGHGVFPLNYAECQKDVEKQVLEQKRKSQINNLIQSVSEISREWVGKVECGELATGQELDYVLDNDKVIGMPFGLARDKLRKLVGIRWTDEKFDEYWSAILDLIIAGVGNSELPVEAVLDATRTRRMVASKYPPYYSLGCRVKRGVWSMLSAYVGEIIGVFIAAVTVSFLFWRRQKFMKLNRVILSVVDDAVDAIVEEGEKYREDPVKYPVPGLPIAQIKEYLLPVGAVPDSVNEEVKKKYGSEFEPVIDEFGRTRWFVSDRNTREVIWQRVTKLMDSNVMVRETSCMMNGETQLLWEWVGSVSLTPKTPYRGAMKTPRKKFAEQKIEAPAASGKMEHELLPEIIKEVKATDPQSEETKILLDPTMKMERDAAKVEDFKTE